MITMDTPPDDVSETHRWYLGDGIYADVTIAGPFLDLPLVRARALQRFSRYADLVHEHAGKDADRARSESVKVVG